MGLSFCLTTLLLPILGTFPTNVSGPILYHLHRGDAQRAFTDYLTFAKENHSHDFLLLQQAAKALLEQGITSKESDIQVLSIFGAGVAASSEMIPILRRGIHSEDLRTQLVSLSYLGKLHDDDADAILQEALSSPFLIIRLEALLQLAKKNHPVVLEHLYSLSVKVPDVVRAVFGQIVVYLESAEASRYLQKLLTDPDVNVRTETILAVAEAHRDDFLPSLRLLARGASCAQQEATAIALGAFKDKSSLNQLKMLAESKQESVKLAAHLALFELGDLSALVEIENAARNHSLFAINLLGQLDAGKESLYQLLTDQDKDVRLNAILALLSQRDRKALAHVEEILFDDEIDTGFWPFSSAGGGHKAWRTIASATQHSKIYPTLGEQTETLREKVLAQCVEFDEEDFLKLASVIFAKKQHALIPLLVELLENKKSEAVIQFLKEGYQLAGAPLIRNYCTLALYRLKVEGPYEEQLILWVKEKGVEELIRFREKKGSSTFNSPYELTPEETSRFLVEACQTLASALNESGIEALIHTMAYGNPKNRYALAGLLLRTTE